MGGRGSSSGGGTYQIVAAGSGGAGAPTIQPNAQAAVAANNATFKATDPNGFHDLYNGRQYFADQNLTIDQQVAAINYLSDSTENGSLYSMSQNLNHALETGQPLTANQQYVYNHLDSAMHNMGYNTNLTRYDHGDMVNSILTQVGLPKDYENYTEAQLKKALVGVKYGERKLVSTSYNDFKNVKDPKTLSTFKDRGIKINYKVKASAQAMMPGNGPGGALGEIILADSKGRKNYEILDVRYNGKMARRKRSQSYSLPQLEIDVLVD